MVMKPYTVWVDRHLKYECDSVQEANEKLEQLLREREDVQKLNKLLGQVAGIKPPSLHFPVIVGPSTGIEC